MRTKRFILFVFLVTFPIAVFFLPLSERLCIITAKDMRVLLIFEKSTQAFSISYTHSVNLSRVRDFYRVAGNQLCLFATRFVAYGAGIPEPEDGQLFRVTEDSLEIYNMNRMLDQLLLQTGVIADHHLETDDRTIVFNACIPPQTRIIIGIRRFSYFRLIRQRFLNGDANDVLSVHT